MRTDTIDIIIKFIGIGAQAAVFFGSCLAAFVNECCRSKNKKKDSRLNVYGCQQIIK